MIRTLLTFVFAVALFGCTTSPLGRSQLILVSDAQLEQMGLTAFDEIKRQTPVTTDARANTYVSCVANAITRVVDPGVAERWNVTVFREDQANAFALPGGRIGVYEGLLKVAENQDQLATVIGHEVAHVIARHPAERISTSYATETGLQLLQVMSGGASSDKSQLFGLLGLGAQVGVLLPFSRAQETEADRLGLDLMAKAGFDPRQSVNLWNNMVKSGGAKPPQFLSTHPSGASRIKDLQARMPSALQLSDAAKAQGRKPQCRR
jgi:predicted Zn-dependent protease